VARLVSSMLTDGWLHHTGRSMPASMLPGTLPWVARKLDPATVARVKALNLKELLSEGVQALLSERCAGRAGTGLLGTDRQRPRWAGAAASIGPDGRPDIC